ncbi:Golgi SNAP receptor complex member 1 [Striga asiatica]|uniref:Golgi SNAP receptor complex member 1 n=1 Tax=Striga asiatica TaxID=4170 RepID=A0A5A7R169_STRAF|nr:Golgi SNAP receptor complex member 1 [Striga asiatica]
MHSHCPRPTIKADAISLVRRCLYEMTHTGSTRGRIHTYRPGIGSHTRRSECSLSEDGSFRNDDPMHEMIVPFLGPGLLSCTRDSLCSPDAHNQKKDDRSEISEIRFVSILSLTRVQEPNANAIPTPKQSLLTNEAPSFWTLPIPSFLVTTLGKLPSAVSKAKTAVSDITEKRPFRTRQKGVR